jgi:hypothetical protein
MVTSEEKLHNIARLFMNQFCYTPASLDEWLYEHSEELTDDERNLGYAILELFND